MSAPSLRPVAGRQTGAVAVEFVLVLPALILLIGLVVGGARVWLARSAVVQAAAAGARAASQERAPAAAKHAGEEYAEAQLSSAGLHCASRRVDVHAAVLATPPGQPGTISVTVRCEVSLAEVLVPGWPGTIEVSATGQAVVDRYRGRG